MKKHGIENFTFTVLKFIDSATPEILTFWEQKYMDLENGLNVFNLSPSAGSPAGIVRSAQTKALMAANSPHNKGVLVTDQSSGTTKSFISITALANELGVSRTTVRT